MHAPANTLPAPAVPTGRPGSPAVTGSAAADRFDQAPHPAAERALPQLRLRGIIAVWAAAALPMGLLSWIAAPLLADQLSGPNALVRALIVTLTAGLAWQFVLVVGLVAREQGTLRWPALREALWLRAPRSPRSGRRGGRLWLVVVALLFAVAAVQLVPGPAAAAGRDLGEFLGSDAGEAFLGGSWGWFAVIVAMFVFNTVIGEELLFRGYLLPRMNGVFGRRDWMGNGVLHGVYHLHVPWAMPGSVLKSLLVSYAAKRYRSALVGIVVHSAQSVIFAALALSLVLNG